MSSRLKYSALTYDHLPDALQHQASGCPHHGPRERVPGRVWAAVRWNYSRAAKPAFVWHQITNQDTTEQGRTPTAATVHSVHSPKQSVHSQSVDTFIQC